jgi:hypothetical protein
MVQIDRSCSICYTVAFPIRGYNVSDTTLRRSQTEGFSNSFEIQSMETRSSLVGQDERCIVGILAADMTNSLCQ